MAKPLVWILLALGLALSPALAQEPSLRLTDAEIADILIARSIRSYSGQCPCPYNLKRNGSRCGASSAYSKPGGAAPLCYRKDVAPGMIERFRRQRGS